jgi:hypothetical protein
VNARRPQNSKTIPDHENEREKKTDKQQDENEDP